MTVPFTHSPLQHLGFLAVAEQEALFLTVGGEVDDVHLIGEEGQQEWWRSVTPVAAVGSGAVK